MKLTPKRPSALDGLFRLYIWSSFHLRYQMLYQSHNQRWSPFAHGRNGCGVSWVQPIQAICFVNLRPDTGKQKTHLALGFPRNGVPLCRGRKPRPDGSDDRRAVTLDRNHFNPTFVRLQYHKV